MNGDRLPTFHDLKSYGSQISQDWHGETIQPEPSFLFWKTVDHFYFLAERAAPAQGHPTAQAGAYQEELWKYDVAEFFLQPAKSTSYLEFNLAPNGAWWSCHFESIRTPMAAEASALKGVRTEHEITATRWQALLEIPLTSLPPLTESRLNANFILDSAPQKFLTATTAHGLTPDFHQPECFATVKNQKIDET